MLFESFKNNQKKIVSLGKLTILTFFFTIITSFQPISDEENHVEWARKTLKTMTTREKIGQLFMVAAYSNKDLAHKTEILDLITNHHIGGLIFFQGGPVRQAVLSNEYQKVAKIPLFMAMDAEWGLSMRLDSTVKYPKQMTLGAIKDQTLIYEMGKQIALQCRRIGMQINFAPVVDVNVNPANPVIGTRSFGENKFEVSQRAIRYINGMQDVFVLANAKHFPGHGDTDTDSHLALPIIKHDTNRLKDIELYPFEQVFKAGVKSVMVAHIHIPAIDNEPNKPTTLSYAAVTKLLKEQMKFNGLSFTDALNMKGVANYNEPGQTDLLALKAGNDVLLYPLDVPKAISVIEKAVAKKEITEADLDQHVLKILEAKHWTKIEKCQFIELPNLYQDLNKQEYEALNYKLRASALTAIKTDVNFPFKIKPNQKILHLVVGNDMPDFDQSLSRYAQVSTKVIAKNKLNSTIIENLKTEANKADYLVISVTDLNSNSSSNYGVNTGITDLIKSIGSQKNAVVCHYGNPYSLNRFVDASTLIAAYENHPLSQKAMAQAIIGAIGINGKLPISAGTFMAGTGIEISPLNIIGFDYPCNVGFDTYTLNKIDSIAQSLIDNKATPGCQILIAKQGKIVYDKNFGFTSYDKKYAVDRNTIYDLASVTKVLGSGMSLMKLAGEGKIDINKKLKDYLPELDSTNKGDLIIKEIIAHQSGLKPFLPLYNYTLENGKPMPNYYSSKLDQEYSLPIAANMFAKPILIDSIYKWTNASELLPKDKNGKYPYKYSDVGYYYMLKIIEKISGKPIEDYLAQDLYQHLNLPSFGYLPFQKFDLNTIAPTEKDTYFRGQLIHGYVHDQGAAMMGGIAGHAGLFSTSFDIAQILQMMLNNGNYGGNQVLSSKIIKEFTSKQLTGDNRKGATWDRMRPEGNGSSSDYTSENSYGHSGFTGTLVWVDPDYDLIYIFLSNRVNPDASNIELLRSDGRTKIQSAIYRSILNYNTQNALYTKRSVKKN
jgi:beta-N-acetylhexosaminidase